MRKKFNLTSALCALVKNNTHESMDSKEGCIKGDMGATWLASHPQRRMHIGRHGGNGNICSRTYANIQIVLASNDKSIKAFWRTPHVKNLVLALLWKSNFHGMRENLGSYTTIPSDSTLSTSSNWTGHLHQLFPIHLVKGQRLKNINFNWTNSTNKKW